MRRARRNRPAIHAAADPVAANRRARHHRGHWRRLAEEEVAHTLRMLELVGRTDIPVFAGAEYPLVRRKAETELWEQRYGSVAWLGAWTPKFYHPPDQ